MNKKTKMAVTGLAAIALVGGTLAYWSQSSTIDNPFSTGGYEGSTTEEFNPGEGDNWKPGATVDKKVYVENTGDTDIWVRVKLSEKWESANDKKTLDLTSTYGEDNEKAFQPNGESTGLQLNAADGLTSGDGSVVYKDIDDSQWKLEGAWYYYRTTLAAGNNTGNLLKSVTLCKDTDFGTDVALQTGYFAVVEKDADEPEFNKAKPSSQWTKYNANTTTLEEALEDAGYDLENIKEKDVYNKVIKEADPTKKGYSNDNYTLTIDTEYIQADAETATAQGWDWYPGKQTAVTP